jgi:cobalt-zinc-cadmium efflux system outer membrane protein
MKKSGEEVNYLMNKQRRVLLAGVLIALQLLQGLSMETAAQTVETASVSHAEAIKDGQAPPDDRGSLAKYVDTVGGLTADEAVAYALAHNAELSAARKEVDAARALVKQAGLRPNPKLDVGGTRQINGKDNSLMVEGLLPLELGGRRAARVRVAEREVELREQAVADRERQLAAEVRAKFGEALAGVLKLGFAEELLATSRRGYRLVMARVSEGRTAPLEQNMVLVEVNRLRSVRETNEGAVAVALLELRNLMGLNPEEPLRLRGDFANMIDPLPTSTEATERALAERPDLLAARAAEALAAAQIEQARAEGRLDADLTAGYQRMNTGFPVNGITDAGQLRPVQDVFHYLTFGVSLSLPVRNKNQGAIEAAAAGAEAAKRRREFLELTIRREVAAGYTRYEYAARAAEIYRVGVRGQADANLDVVRKTYELGSKTLLDYIAEQRRYIELEGAYIDALLDTYRARVEIERATAAPELIKR